MKNIFFYIAHSRPNCLKDMTQSCKLCAAKYGKYMAKFSVPYHRGRGVWDQKPDKAGNMTSQNGWSTTEDLKRSTSIQPLAL